MERAIVPRGKRPRVQVSQENKELAIARIRNGETKASISRELGVPESTVRGWVKRADQRIARGILEGKENASPPTQLQRPVKRDHNGQPAAMTPVGVPMPIELFEQAANSQLQLTDWLHIFNAGILNFTLVATAAYLRACSRGTTDRQSLWQIICEYVDEAGRNVAANGGAVAFNRQFVRTVGIVAPRLHITAEDDEDDAEDGYGGYDENALRLP
ncbi:uncharacterized protein LOC6559319 [Drosophila grimshawi]|uniref:GH21351 n=1 Tax=Drosophila grimshawi TaxID=7222 RepID=B4J8L2_DROGR|nr:uncharacterized protein LOC6559319 [Drosophila grimshawi]EDW01279.1 GH21351 [Drosophila grimshawi]